MRTPLVPQFSLRILLPLVIGLFAVAVGTMSYYSTAELLREKIEQQALFDTRQQLTLAQGVIETFLRANNREAAERLIASFGSDGSTRFAVLTDREEVIIGSTRFSDIGRTPSGRGYTLDTSLLDRIRRTGGIETAVHPGTDTVTGVVSICERTGEDNLRPAACGYLYLEKRLSYFAAPLEGALGRQSLQAAVGLLAAGFLMWLLLHAIVTRRAHDIVTTVDRFARDQRESRTGLRGGDEIARIGIAVDRMLDDIVENERRLRDNEALLSTILDGVAEGIITFDDNGRVVSFNAGAKRIFGYRPEDLIGEDIGKLLVSPADRIELLPDQPLGETTIGCELTARHRNGTPLETEWRLRKTTFGVREIVTAVVRDISELKKLAALQKEFTSVVSHELRTPLTSLHGSLRMLTSGALNAAPEQANQLLGMAERNSRRLLNLVNDILDVHKLGMDSLELNHSHIELAELVHRCAESNHGYFEKYGVNCHIEINARDTCIEGDEFRIEQVVTNLLSNATKYSPMGSDVSIVIEETGDGEALGVSVADQGRGIPEAFRERIFEPFFQVDSSDARDKEGTGLGLSICRAIVDKHGGTLDFESRPGQGTRFFFVLPRSQRTTSVPGAVAGNTR